MDQVMEQLKKMTAYAQTRSTLTGVQKSILLSEIGEIRWLWMKAWKELSNDKHNYS